MNGKTKVKAVVGLLAALAIGGWFALPQGTNSLGVEAADTKQHQGSGILDGMTFASELGPVGKPADVKDKLVFANGMFVSTECERMCNYPASTYFTRGKGELTEFISETRCPHKDAKIVWRGEVRDGKIKGIATWTTNRWYWTVEKDIAFEGTVTQPSSPIASAN